MSIKYWDELTPEQQEKVLDKVQDLSLFAEFRENARTLFTGNRLYAFDAQLNVHALSGE